MLSFVAGGVVLTKSWPNSNKLGLEFKGYAIKAPK